MKKADWRDNIREGHHAYLIAGDVGEIPKLKSFLEEKWKFSTTGNPDFNVVDYPTLYIEDCREIEKKARNRTLGKVTKVFVLSFGFMTREASNSLLKLFEEPGDSIFFAITPNPERLPVTLLSRFVRLNNSRGASANFKDEALKFMSLTLGERFDYSKKFASDITDEKRTRADALALLEGVEELAFENDAVNKSNIEMWKSLELYRDYLKDQSSSVKIILDSVALEIGNFRA